MHPLRELSKQAKQDLKAIREHYSQDLKELNPIPEHLRVRRQVVVHIGGKPLKARKSKPTKRRKGTFKSRVTRHRP